MSKQPPKHNPSESSISKPSAQDAGKPQSHTASPSPSKQPASSQSLSVVNKLKAANPFKHFHPLAWFESKQEHTPEAEELNEFFADKDLQNMRGPNQFSHWLLWCCIAFFVIAFIWAKLAVIDEVAHAEGKVIPSRQVQVIQNLEGGILRELKVQEGETVEKDQVLMLIDDTKFSSDFKEGQLKEQELGARIARLKAEAQDKPFEIGKAQTPQHAAMLSNEKVLYISRKSELRSKIETLEQQVQQKKHELTELIQRKAQLARSYNLVKRELDMTAPLVKDGAVSEVEVLRLRRETNDLKGQMDATVVAIPRAQSAVKEFESKIEELKQNTRTQILDELNKARGEYVRVLASNQALHDRVSRTAVRSPVKGTVKQININTIGGVIKPGMDLMEVVPLDDSLLVEAKVSPRDIAFIHPGQKAIVKFTAYDFSIYGGLEGKVEHISADTLLDEKQKSYYEIRVRTQKTELKGPDKKALPIIPGMQTSVDILTGKKSVLDYLLKPILKTKQRALRER